MRRLPSLVPLASLTLITAACTDVSTSGATTEETTAAAGVCTEPILTTADILPERSLAITDPAVIGGANGPFRLEAVLRQLVRQANPALTDATSLPVAQELYQQWWASFDVTNGDTARPHCDSPDPRAVPGVAGPSFNGFRWACPRGERNIQNTPMPNWTPTALFYRPDLMPPTAANCGEARIVYARDGSTMAIFEAKIPNPTPGCSAGCRQVAQFWANFSTERVNGQRLNAATMQTRLVAFYMTGTAIPGLGPVIHINNLAGSSNSGGYSSSSGQVRTNVLSDFPWELKEFAVRRLTTTNARRIELRPQTDKVNPSPLLFGNLPTGSDPASAERRTRMQAFRTHFINNDVEKLAFGDINTFTMDPPDTANSGQSRSLGGDAENPNTDYRDAAGIEMRNLIDQRLVALRNRAVNPLVNSSIGVQEILARATAMSCGGCHINANGAFIGFGPNGEQQNWPNSAGFVHVTNFQGGRDINGGNSAFFISDALTQVFLPARARTMLTVLNGGRCTTCPSPSASPTPVASPSPSPSSAFASSGSGLSSASASPSPSPSSTPSPSSSPAPSSIPAPQPWSQTIGGRTVH